MKFFQQALYGLLIGVANIIPGVSGGTIAVMLGIYDQLIDAVSSLRRRFWDSVRYLFPIGVGAVAGILLFSHLLKFLLGTYPGPTNFFFLGLILGGIPVIIRRIRSSGRLRPVSIVPLIAAFLCMILLFVFSRSDGGPTALITSLTFGRTLQFFFCGALAAACMILPGVSGSMVMMLLGVYYSILTAIAELNIILLLPVAFGILLGFFGGAKLIGLCLHRWEQGAYSAILGLIAGSLFPVLNNAQIGANLQGVFSIVTLILGVLFSLWMLRLQKHFGG